MQEAADALRDVVGGWVPWAGALLFVLFLVMWIVGMRVYLVWRLAGLDPALPWTDLARMLFPIRTALTSWMLAVVLVPILATAFSGPLSDVSDVGLTIVGIAIFGTGAAWNSWFLARTVGTTQGVTPTDHAIKFALYYGFFGAVVLVGGLWDVNWVLWLVASIGVFFAMTRWRAVFRATELLVDPPDWVAASVGRAAESLERPAPKVYEFRTASLGAYAHLGANLVLFTSPTIAAMDGGEIEAIARHEIAHLHQPASTHLRGAYLPVLVVFGLSSAAIGDLLGWVGYPLVLAGFALFSILISRGRAHEAEADEVAGSIDAAMYGRALEKLYRLGLLPAGGVGKSHPDLYDRLVAVGVEPDFQRPAPPRRNLATLGVVVVTTVVMFLFVLAPSTAFWVDDRTRAELKLGLATYPVEQTVTEVGLLVADTRRELALSSWEASIAHTESAFSLSRIAVMLAEAGECETVAGTLGRMDELGSPEDAEFVSAWLTWCWASQGPQGA